MATVPPSALPRPFRPAGWLPGPHLQTLAGKFLRRSAPPPLRRERWDTPDGDFLDLDFGPDPGASAPRVLVLHGLEGNSRRAYCQESYRSLTARGIAAIGLNFRSCSGEPNRRARSYHSGETGDLAWVVQRLRQEAPARALGVMGFSLGGNVLVKLLGELGPTARDHIEAAVAISVPYDLSASSTLLERGFARIVYARYFLRMLLAKAREKEHLLSDHVDFAALEQISTLRDYDDVVTAPVHGFEDAEDYYRRSSCGPFVPEVRIPTLLLHSTDDPLVPHATLPMRDIARNPHLHPMLTSNGGHVGFVAGRFAKPRFWAEESAARFLAELL